MLLRENAEGSQHAVEVFTGRPAGAICRNRRNDKSVFVNLFTKLRYERWSIMVLLVADVSVHDERVPRLLAIYGMKHVSLDGMGNIQGFSPKIGDLLFPESTH